MSKSRVPFLTGYLAVRIRHAMLQITVITNKMQHFMAKMLKKILGGGTAPSPDPSSTGRGHPLPILHPLQHLTPNAFGVQAPLVTIF